MNNRLQEIIKYKTGGKQTAFANLFGWTPQYLAKLLRGENFGLQPVISIITAFPEVNARWLLTGEGEMLEVGKLYQLQRDALGHIMELLDLDKYIPYMQPEDIHEFEQAVRTGRKPLYSPEKRSEWERRAEEQENAIDAKFAAARRKSDKLCRQRTAK